MVRVSLVRLSFSSPSRIEKTLFVFYFGLLLRLKNWGTHQALQPPKSTRMTTIRQSREHTKFFHV